ncbi:hypothetical protein ZEAMMB73_Zm00001d016761 [Zea mays]|uniref:DUF4283 domain-containing protein n=1 Tax=Zea mays TaxID=4577 RepID=A0A1D6HA64_MAIZE|nr:hypothetical protein ZEAMMB73_Zm00001d016761 [Zea mays]
MAWKEVDRRRHPRIEVKTEQQHLGGHRLSRGRGPSEDRGRRTWHSRGGRYGGRPFHGAFRAPQDFAESSEGGGSRVREEAEKKRAAVDGPAADDQGNKRKEKLCCELCEMDHTPQVCPTFNGPKPHALLCGFAGGDSGFFQIPTSGAKGMAPKKDNATTFITAMEGNITTDLVKAELARLIPVNWTWSVQQHADGFEVPFPCNVELQRMIAMKYVHTAGGEGIMVIQELDQKIEPVQYLQKVWVNVYGVPYEIRSFLPLWVVGTIIGATQKVDLRYTRKMGVVRILVGVIDVDSIPESSDIVVGEGLYEIYFKVDKVCKDGVWMGYKQEVTKDKGDDDEQDEEFDGLDEYIHKTDAAFQDTEMEDKSTNNNGNPKTTMMAVCNINTTMRNMIPKIVRLCIMTMKLLQS